MGRDVIDGRPQLPGRNGLRELPGEDAVPGLLRDWQRGDREAAEELMLLVYGELRRIAACLLAGADRDDVLDPTALVHEVYLKLEGAPVVCHDRAHFFALAARMMRQTVVDQARTNGRLKRGGASLRVSLEAADRLPAASRESRHELDEALAGLGRHSPRLAAVVELRCFGGLSVEETAACLGVSQVTVVREWRRARAWLRRALER